MRLKRKNKFNIPSKYILMVLTIVCIAVMYASFTMNLSGGPLNTVASTVFAPMQKGINEIGLWIMDKADNLKNLREVMSENEQLKQQVDELTSELNTIKLNQYELDELRELLELDEQYPDYEKVAAHVVSKDAGNWFSFFQIDKGYKDGVEVDNNVIAGGGLVGIVTSVGPHNAKVRAIIDDISSVYGMVLNTSDNCTISGDLMLMTESQTIELKSLNDRENKVQVGDPLVTSPVSSKFLPGILIGYISTLEKDANNLTKSGTVTPVVDFEHIQDVLVILEKKEDVTAEVENSTEETE